MSKSNKKGFSLLELTLVLSVGSLMAFIKFQDMKTEQDSVLANAVGFQMKQMGEAVNRYISIRYDKLSTLSSSSNQTSDPGPKTCTVNGCEITYQTLINEGLLPATYAGTNTQKSSYKIMLKRSGIAPNYVINGLITTTNGWSDSGKVRYDLLGRAIQSAGVDSGMTLTSTVASGYGGQWTEKSSDYSNITAEGQLVYRVGYDSSMYSVYLRRDGTLPMTGDLNMGNRSIINAVDITASGRTLSGELQSTGNTSVGAMLNVTGSSSLSGDTTIGKNLAVGGNTQVSGTINAVGTLSGATVSSSGETYTNGWFRTMGDGGIYFQKYGGGWNMTDVNTIQAYAGKNISTVAGIYGSYIHSSGNIVSAGQVTGDTVVSGGRTQVGEYLQINGQAQQGGACSPNGLIGRTLNGNILSCVNGGWKSPNGGLKRIFIRVNGSCFVPNSDTGECSCPGGITGQYGYLSGTIIAQYNNSQCSGGQNTHCTNNYRELYACKT